MPWKKAPESLIEAFDTALPSDERVERRKMFGYPCAFVNGNMFAGTHEHRLIVRLSEAERDALLALPGASRFEPMPGRVMREYAIVPPSMLDDRRTLKKWLGRSFAFAAALPPKPKRRTAKAKTARPAARKRR